MKYDVCVASSFTNKDGEKIKVTHRVGVAYENKKGVINLLIGPSLIITEATPLVLFPGRNGVSETSDQKLDDEVPF